LTTSVPSLSITDAGVSIPSEVDILAGIQADISAAFGGGVNPGLSTPQGQLAQSLTAIIGDANGRLAEIVSGIDPDNASGRFQDAIARLYFLDRIPASGTVVIATCSGLVGSVLPAGLTAQDLNGNRYISTVGAVIGSTGGVDVPFQCSTTGPIACAPANLTTIVTSSPGWESITNVAAGSPGVDVEGRVAFEQRRRDSVALNSQNALNSIYAAVLAVPNVVDAYAIDNPTGASVNVGSTSYPIPSHSMCIAVAGGGSAAIAKAIWSKKPPGCGYAGNTSATVTDTASLASPQPQYTVTWLTPTAVNVYFKVQIANDSTLPSDIVARIQSAVVAAFQGLDGGARARIGSKIYSGRYYSAVAATSSKVQILSVAIGPSPSGATASSMEFGIDRLPTITPANVAVILV
jgi:Baseplate J-like protein